MPVTILALIESVVHLSQISALSSVQLSPNRVREDFRYGTVYAFPMFQVSPDAAEYLAVTSPVTPPVTGCVSVTERAACLSCLFSSAHIV